MCPVFFATPNLVPGSIANSSMLLLKLNNLTIAFAFPFKKAYNQSSVLQDLLFSSCHKHWWISEAKGKRCRRVPCWIMSELHLIQSPIMPSYIALGSSQAAFICCLGGSYCLCLALMCNVYRFQTFAWVDRSHSTALMCLVHFSEQCLVVDSGCILRN